MKTYEQNYQEALEHYLEDENCPLEVAEEHARQDATTAFLEAQKTTLYAMCNALPTN